MPVHRRYRHVAFETVVFDTVDGQMHDGEWSFNVQQNAKWIWLKTTEYGRGAWESFRTSTNTNALTEIHIVGPGYFQIVEEIEFSGRNLLPDEDALSVRRPARKWSLHAVGRGRGTALLREPAERSDAWLTRRSVLAETVVHEPITARAYADFGLANADVVTREV